MEADSYFCYLHSDSKLGWDDARRYCVDRGGDLASVHSADENNFVLNIENNTEIVGCSLKAARVAS